MVAIIRCSCARSFLVRRFVRKSILPLSASTRFHRSMAGQTVLSPFFFQRGQIGRICQNRVPTTMTFASRTDAGQRLGRFLAEQEIRADLVLGLPRGGVIVAAEVASILKCPLDVLVVRKIGHPGHREFAVGALAEQSTLVLDEDVINRTGVSPADLKEVLAEETERLTEYQARFLRANRPLLKDKIVLIVDDGLATGAT